MPVYLRLVNLEKRFHEQTSEKIILNDLPYRTTEDREALQELVSSTYTTDMISVMPKCACPEGHGLYGEHVLGEYCDICGTVVKRAIENEIASTLWFRSPKGVEKLINPVALNMLMKRFTKSGFNIIRWLVDLNYVPGKKTPSEVTRMIADQVPRGYNAFIRNFDAIMEYLFSMSAFKYTSDGDGEFDGVYKPKHPSGDPLQELIWGQREAVFTDVIPLPDKSLVVIEKGSLGTFVEKSVFGIRDVINTMVGLDRDHHDRDKPIKRENRTGKILCMLAEYHAAYNKTHFDPKSGLLRKHNYGSRTNLSFRAVITSHEDSHQHDEIHIPWCVGTTVLRLHLMRYLLDPHHPYGGMTENEAVAYLYKHVYRYDARLHELLNQVIHGGTYPRGLACMHLRNKLRVGSL